MNPADWAEQMYLFVDRHPEGVREKDVKEAFEGKGFNKVSHETFVKYWKQLKESENRLRVVPRLDQKGVKRYYTPRHVKEKLKDVTALQLLNQLEEKLGSQVDLTALNSLVDRLNSLLYSGAHVSPREAETAKLDMDLIIAETKMRTKKRESKAALDLLDALKVYLRLVVDSLVNR